MELSFRNVAEVDLKVYPVDLMRLYLTRRSLDGIAGIDLAGVTPKYETKIKLGDGADFRDRLKVLDLPLEKEGAYLVMARGDDLYASGVVLVTPLEMEVREEPAAGRVRVTVRDAKTRDFVPKVLVKVIGSGNRRFFGGETDLRGVFVTEGVVGQVTAVARRGEGQYAFYRGVSWRRRSRSAPRPRPIPAGSRARGRAGRRRVAGGEPPFPELHEPGSPARPPQAALCPARECPPGRAGGGRAVIWVPGNQ